MCSRHHFQFEIDRAIRSQVIEKLETSPPHALEADVGPPVNDIYALYLREKFVYGGKAETKTTLKRRLNEHRRRIAGRRQLDIADVSCRWLEIESEWFVRAAEEAIIEHYKGDWQKSGFGRHAPGRGRPGIRPSKWDERFPSK